MAHQPRLPISQDAEFLEGWKDGFPVLVPQFGDGPIATYIVDELGTVIGLNSPQGPVGAIGGGVLNVVGTEPIEVATGTTVPVISILPATTSAPGSLSAADKATIDNLPALLGAKQNILISATNIKTVNGASLLGAGDLTVPDSPIRLNPRTITASFTVASAYNAASAGPITISEGVTVTISDNATWSIH